MPPAIGIHIVKSAQWRGKAEEFENVYHYDRNPDLMTEQDYDALVNAIVDIEKTIFANTVTFLRAVVHGPTHLTKDEDRMRFAKDLTGTGSVLNAEPIPREMAVVTQLYMGRSPAPHFRKTFLRKYWHVCSLQAADGNGRLGNEAMTSTNRDFYKGKLNALKTVVAQGVNMNLCKPNGHGVPLGTDAFCLPQLRVRQFRR